MHCQRLKAHIPSSGPGARVKSRLPAQGTGAHVSGLRFRCTAGGSRHRRAEIDEEWEQGSDYVGSSASVDLDWRKC